MKYLLTALIFFQAFVSNAQLIKVGDNLKTEFGKISKPYFFPAPGFSGWAEEKNMFFIGERSKPKDCKFLFIALQDTTLIGVFLMSDPSMFIIDTEGNSTLTNTSEFFFLPSWVVKKRTKIDSTDTSILSLLNRMYEKTLQANDLEMDEKTIKEYQQYQKDTRLANRHIALLFDTYQNIITETTGKGQQPPTEICISILESLSAECESLYKTVPVIVTIYLGEALLTADKIDKAREHFKNSLSLYPQSIPLRVYNYRLEQDPIKKTEQLADLKRKYAKHWMVKDLN